MQRFWIKLKEFLKKHNIHIDVPFKSITFGLHKRKGPDIKINYFIMFNAKYFIFSNKYQKEIPM